MFLLNSYVIQIMFKLLSSSSQSKEENLSGPETEIWPQTIDPFRQLLRWPIITISGASNWQNVGERYYMFIRGRQLLVLTITIIVFE